MKNLRRALVAISLGLASNAHAASILDTGDPRPWIGLGLFHGSVSYQAVAAKFEIFESTKITDLWGNFSCRTCGNLVVGISSSDKIGLVGESVFSDILDASAPTLEGYFNRWIGLQGLNLILSPGEYWLTFDIAPGSSFDGSMYGSVASPALGYATRNNFIPEWHNVLAPAPEATFTLYFGVRINGDPIPPAVPESATWAMMIAGFALAGISMRKRKSVVRFA